MDEGKSRFKSKTYIANIVAVLSGIIVAVFGFQIAPDQQEAITGGAFALMGVINLVLREFTKEPLKRRQ